MNDNWEKEEQVDNLINLVENHTRTERHLEQYSDIGSKRNIDNAIEKQNVREEEINNLKNKILNNSTNQKSEEQFENLKENFEKTGRYVENNYENIDEEQLTNIQKKQAHRKEQLKNENE